MVLDQPTYEFFWMEKQVGRDRGLVLVHKYLQLTSASIAMHKGVGGVYQTFRECLRRRGRADSSYGHTGL